MSTVITIFIILVCILLIIVVLIQNSKGGGLSSQFAGSNQIMGVRRTADFLEKATYTLAIALLVLSLLSAASLSKGTVASDTPAGTSETKQKLQEGGNINITPPAKTSSTKPQSADPAADKNNKPK
ncbi:MAG: preprotein translocase subunit SecG [Bacteroidia bacterium]